MKLRNKKTGEIVELDYISAHYSHHYDYGEGRSGEQPCSTMNKSLAELNEEWEDYEESEEHRWYIDCLGEAVQERPSIYPEYAEYRETIGNHFSTKEEAERAVEKLKARKRLKDKGFKFGGWRCEDQKLSIRFYFGKKDAWATEVDPDLDLLFGGEE